MHQDVSGRIVDNVCFQMTLHVGLASDCAAADVAYGTSGVGLNNKGDYVSKVQQNATYHCEYWLA